MEEVFALKVAQSWLLDSQIVVKKEESRVVPFFSLSIYLAEE